MSTNFTNKNISSIKINDVKYNIKSAFFHAKESEWKTEELNSYIPKQGEIVIYDIDDVYAYERFKIGDGVQNVNDLPFYNDGFVSYSEAQTLTEEQKAQARENLDVPIKTIALTNNIFNIWEHEPGVYVLKADPSYSIAIQLKGKKGIGEDATAAYADMVYASSLLVEVDKRVLGTKDIWTVSYKGNLNYRIVLNLYDSSTDEWKISFRPTLPDPGNGSHGDPVGLTLRVKDDGLNYELARTVWSVNGQTDDVTITAEDIGAATQEYVSSLVGDTAVSEQITTALTASSVLYSEAQELTDEQKQQAQDNIGFSETDAIELTTNMGLISPVAAEDGSVYTDENGALYSL